MMEIKTKQILIWLTLPNPVSNYTDLLEQEGAPNLAEHVFDSMDAIELDEENHSILFKLKRYSKRNVDAITKRIQKYSTEWANDTIRHVDSAIKETLEELQEPDDESHIAEIRNDLDEYNSFRATMVAFKESI